MALCFCLASWATQIWPFTACFPTRPSLGAARLHITSSHAFDSSPGLHCSLNALFTSHSQSEGLQARIWLTREHGHPRIEEIPSPTGGYKYVVVRHVLSDLPCPLLYKIKSENISYYPLPPSTRLPQVKQIQADNTIHIENLSIMQLLHLLPLASLALALPYANDINAKRQASCYSQEWNIQQYTTFDAGATSPAGGPAAFGYSHIAFLFTDPNFNLQYECSAEAESGKSLSSLEGYNTYYCDGGNMTFQYFGSTVTLQRTGVECGK